MKNEERDSKAARMTPGKGTRPTGMTALEREQVRMSTLRYCEAAQDMGLATSILLQTLHAEGLGRLRMEQLREELRYLEEKGLLKRKFKLISPENEIWQLTAAGRDFLAQGDVE